MNTNPPSDQIPALIQRAVEQETARIIEEEAKAAAERTVVRVRESVGAIAGRVLSNFSFEQIRHELRITVNFENGGAK